MQGSVQRMRKAAVYQKRLALDLVRMEIYNMNQRAFIASNWTKYGIG